MSYSRYRTRHCSPNGCEQAVVGVPARSADPTSGRTAAAVFVGCGAGAELDSQNHESGHGTEQGNEKISGRAMCLNDAIPCGCTMCAADASKIRQIAAAAPSKMKRRPKRALRGDGNMILTAHRLQTRAFRACPSIKLIDFRVRECGFRMQFEISRKRHLPVADTADNSARICCWLSLVYSSQCDRFI